MFLFISVVIRPQHTHRRRGERYYWHKLVYYPHRQKAVLLDVSCIQVQRKQTAVQTQHLNLTTKILSMSTIKLGMAAVTLNPFVLWKTINTKKEKNLNILQLDSLQLEIKKCFLFGNIFIMGKPSILLISKSKLEKDNQSLRVNKFQMCRNIVKWHWNDFSSWQHLNTCCTICVLHITYKKQEFTH